MGFNIHILSGRNRSTNLAGHAALAASFNPSPSHASRDLVSFLSKLAQPDGHGLSKTSTSRAGRKPSQAFPSAVNGPLSSRGAMQSHQNTVRSTATNWNVRQSDYVCCATGVRFISERANANIAKVTSNNPPAIIHSTDPSC